MKKRCVLHAASAIVMLASALSAQAANVMPDFADVPNGWVTDRYAPASFSNVGSYQGRNNVLGIGISSAGDAANRAPGQKATFYNTQGRQHAVSGASGSWLGAGLFVNQSWSSAANGPVRSDMWAVGSNGTSVTDYGIIGFTNMGGSARLRIYDADVGGDGWVNLATAVAYDAWNDFIIQLTDTSFDYYVNGTQVYRDTTIDATQFSAVIMQAYNFADPGAFAGVSTVDYVAHWSNVPEPASLALFGLAFAGLAASRRRQSNRAAGA